MEFGARSGRLWAAGLIAVIGATPGCSESATGPEPTQVVTLTVDASEEEEWAFVALGSTPVQVSVANATASTAWDLGFQKTAVKANGGEDGPGEVLVFCVCQNAGATNEEIMAMTSASEFADFEGVTARDIPSNPASWSSVTFENNRWYRYNLTGQHLIWPTFDVYLVKRGGDVFKVQLINYYGPAGEQRHITFRSSQLVG
jgi:hypothetical protein